MPHNLLSHLCPEAAVRLPLGALILEVVEDDIRAQVYARVVGHLGAQLHEEDVMLAQRRARHVHETHPLVALQVEIAALQPPVVGPVEIRQLQAQRLRVVVADEEKQSRTP